MSSQVYRLLAVDDVPDNLFLLQTILEMEGFVVDVATSGSIALRKIKAAPPDLILLDVMMPGMNGYEVTQQIRQDDTLPSIPILLISAHDEASAIRGIELGANDFICKPIDFNELLTRVRTYLRLTHSVEPGKVELAPVEPNNAVQPTRQVSHLGQTQ
ncbi:response regulator [Leptolyngbya sp. FACHB-321]|uniref:response regulator transcription factor n=1 Tax=Leptolyngbya sp. FACHB-321 TaxID=2692807 RepID=UPI001681C318|nr:response regulator [Leptolyngbya sp. FACHB-321]MBD2038526.1 response regulator [Leptolyngbya sp. FACHB-321]